MSIKKELCENIEKVMRDVDDTKWQLDHLLQKLKNTEMNLQVILAEIKDL